MRTHFREIRTGVRTLMLHKLRSVLTMLGVVFGVGSVVAMLAVGEGASTDALKRIEKLGSSNILITSMRPAEEEQSRTRRNNSAMAVYGITYADFDRIKETIPDVKRIVPVKLVRREGQLDDRRLDLRLVGTTHDWFDLVPRPVLAGRILGKLDEETHGGAVVLTEHGARRLLATEKSIGQPVRIGGSMFEVIGIVKNETAQGGGAQTPDSEVDAYIPLSVARGRFGDIQNRAGAGNRLRDRIELNQIILQASGTDAVPRTALAVERLLQRFHEGPPDYQMSVPLALLREAEATKRTFNIVLGSIAGISLLVGGIGIMNIMLASVTERTREIGIRRAIGAKRRQIVGQFLIETVVLSSTGGLIGVGIGLLIPTLITRLAQMPTVVTPESLVLSLGISMAIGIIFGLYPAARAARLDPIVALRHE